MRTTKAMSFLKKDIAFALDVAETKALLLKQANHAREVSEQAFHMGDTEDGHRWYIAYITFAYAADRPWNSRLFQDIASYGNLSRWGYFDSAR